MWRGTKEVNFSHCQPEKSGKAAPQPKSQGRPAFPYLAPMTVPKIRTRISNVLQFCEKNHETARQETISKPDQRWMQIITRHLIKVLHLWLWSGIKHGGVTGLKGGVSKIYKWPSNRRRRCREFWKVAHFYRKSDKLAILCLIGVGWITALPTNIFPCTTTVKNVQQCTLPISN